MKGELVSCVQATPPPPKAERQACNSQSWKTRAISSPETGILNPTVSRLPVDNHVFLGSWVVDNSQEGPNLRSAPQRRHTARLRRCSCLAPGKPSGWDQEVIKTHGPPGTVCLSSTWSSEWLRPGKGKECTPNRVCALEEYMRTSTWAAQTWNVHEMQGPFWRVLLQSNLEPEKCRLGKHTLPWPRANPVWSIRGEHSSYTPMTFVCSVPPSPQHSWESEPK